MRAALVFCVVLLSFPVGAEAYPCAPSSARTLSSVSVEDCRKAGQKPPKRAEPNLLSLTLFVVAVLGVLLIPINYARRSEPE